MNSLEILRTMGQENYKKNSLKLAKEIIELLKEIAPKLVSEYEKDSELFPSKELSNGICEGSIKDIIRKFDGRVASDAYGEPVEFNMISQFRESFSLRIDLIFNRQERTWSHPGTEKLVEIGEDLWGRTGAGHVAVDGALSKEQLDLLWIINFKQRMENHQREYASGLGELKRFSIDLEDIDLMKFNYRLDQIGQAYWDSRQSLRDVGINNLDNFHEDKYREIKDDIFKIKKQVDSAKWRYETRKKNLEDQGLDPENFDLWGTAGT
jgi:hypothetical protein